MFPQPHETIVRRLELVTGDPLAEFEGGALPLTEMRASPIHQNVGELLHRDTHFHADGVADIHSVGHAVERSHLHVEQGAKLSIDLPEPLDGTVEATEPQHEWQPMHHETFRSRYLAEHPFPDSEERPRQQARPFDLRNLFHEILLRPKRQKRSYSRSSRGLPTSPEKKRRQLSNGDSRLSYAGAPAAASTRGPTRSE